MRTTRFLALAIAIPATFVPVTAFAATKTSTAKTVAAPVETAAAKPVVTVAPSVAAVSAASQPTLVAPVGGATAKSSKKSKNVVPAKVVIAGNFCKKVLIGQSSHDKAGVVLNCVADAKGQPRWTK